MVKRVARFLGFRRDQYWYVADYLWYGTITSFAASDSLLMLRSHIVTLSQKKPKMLEAIGSPRILTLSVAIFCVLVFLLDPSGSNAGSICLYPSRVVTHFEIYRIATAPFFHGGFFHILFNIIAWMFIARDFEKMTGTLAAAYSIFVLLIPLTAIFHCLAAYLVDALSGTNCRNACAIGISGILFALLVVNLESSPGTSVNVCGLFTMPSRWYPWLLALVLQLFSPNLSFLGHLSGITMGYILVFGYLERITPADYKLAELEENLRLTSLPLWLPSTTYTGIAMIGRSTLPETNASDNHSFPDRVRDGWSGITSWFSGSTTSTSQPFSGHGRTLGGGEGTASVAGRVPPTSRLLQTPPTRKMPSQHDQSESEAQDDKGGNVDDETPGSAAMNGQQ